MPYRIGPDGKSVQVQKDGRWVTKYHHKTHAEALAQLRALYVHDPHAKGGGKQRRKK